MGWERPTRESVERAVVQTVGTMATYLPADGGDPIALHVIFEPQAERLGEYGQVVEVRPEAGFLEAVVPEPSRGDRVLINGDLFTVWHIGERRAGLIRVALRAGG